MNGQRQFTPPSSDTNTLKFQPSCDISSWEMTEVTKKSGIVTSPTARFGSWGDSSCIGNVKRCGGQYTLGRKHPSCVPSHNPYLRVSKSCLVIFNDFGPFEKVTVGKDTFFFRFSQGAVKQLFWGVLRSNFFRIVKYGHICINICMISWGMWGLDVFIPS